MSGIDEDPVPNGALTLQSLTLPADTNQHGDIFGGWLMSKMDLAGSILAQEIATGRVTTVAVGSMVFLRPVAVGTVVSCYAQPVEVGRSSIRVLVEVWLKEPQAESPQKVTESEFVYVAIDDHGRTRPVTK